MAYFNEKRKRIILDNRDRELFEKIDKQILNKEFPISDGIMNFVYNNKL